MVPKSNKLQREEEDGVGRNEAMASSISLAEPPQIQNGPVQVRRVDCCNDFVAILQTQIDSMIELAGTDAKYKNEGLIVGVGNGVADGAGGRLIPCVDFGEYVMFGERNVIQRIESDKPPYKGRVIVIVSEKNIICKLPNNVDWENYEGE